MNLLAKTILISGAVLMTAYCTHKATREPAAAKEVLTTGEARALAELLGGDSPLNSYRHKMTVQFHTDGDQKYLSTTALKALQEALTETLGTENPEQGLAKLAAGNIRDALIENFVKTLKVYKIINIGLQLDLMFLPEPNNKNDYANELNSNQLVRLNETGQLSAKWARQEKSTTTNTLYNNSAYVPFKKGALDYLGGSMSLYIKIMDVGLGIPKIKKNAVKGFVRYRRYYRSMQDPRQPSACGDFILTAKSPSPATPMFYTVDLYKNFNLKNLLPTEETLEIFPGALVSHNEGRSELMPDTYEKSGKAIVTGTFLVEKKNNPAEQISFQLKKIVYDLKDRELDGRRSDIELVQYSSVRGGEGIAEDQQALSNASHTYLKKCESSMKQFMNIESLVQGGLL